MSPTGRDIKTYGVRCMQLGNESVAYDQLNYRTILNEQTNIPQLPVKVQYSRTVTQDYLTVPLHACPVEERYRS